MPVLSASGRVHVEHSGSWQTCQGQSSRNLGDPTYLMEMLEIRIGVKGQMCLINNFDCSSVFLGDNAIRGYSVSPSKFYILKSSLPVPQNVILSGNRVFADIIKVGIERRSYRIMGDLNPVSVCL